MNYSTRPTGLLWGIYARLSEDRAGAGIGVDRQIEEDLELITRIDPTGTIVGIYSDNDISAYKKRRRKDFERMRADIACGSINAVAAWHIDRLTRRPVEIEGLVDLAEETGAIFACRHGDIDLSTPTGRLFARQLGAWARYEIEQKTLRQQLANRSAAKNGKAWCGGLRCYGYADNGVDVVEEEAKIIREIMGRIFAGASMRSIMVDLDERGIVTTAGNPWTNGVTRRLLMNPRLTGKRVYKGEVIAQGDWQPIMTDEEQARITAILTDPARQTSANPGKGVRKYLLTGGIAKCGLCGVNLSSQKAESGNRGYVCRKNTPTFGCGRIRIAADLFEQDLAAKVLARFASAAVRKRLAAASAPSGETSVATQLCALEEQLKDLGRDFGLGRVQKTAFYAAQGVIAEQIDALRGKLAQAERINGLPSEATPEFLAAWWRTADLEQRRSLVLVVLDHVAVMPSTRRGWQGLDQERLNYVWR